MRNEQRQTRRLKALALTLGFSALFALPAFAETAEIHASATKDQVIVSDTVSGDNTSGGGKLYFSALDPYNDNIEEAKPVAGAPYGANFSFTAPPPGGTPDTRLYDQFAIMVWKNGHYYDIGRRAYITNPEVVAKSDKPYEQLLTRKGLLVQLDTLSDVFELGVKRADVNPNFAQITAGTGIDYTYEGKTYHFDKNRIAEYDKSISVFSGKSMMVMAIVLNDWSDKMPELIHPGIKKTDGALYYGFNAMTKESYETTRVLMSFLAQRYNDENPAYGRVSNWIIGNEINNGRNWNYIGKMDIDEYVTEYVRAFRVACTAIKAQQASAHVFFSVDMNWSDPNADQKTQYSTKYIIDKINAEINRSGSIDWQLAYRPYSYPLTEPEFWDDHTTGLIAQNESPKVIDLENLHVLTDYLKASNFRNRAGEVRHIILSEQDFSVKSPSRGDVETQQAAVLAYTYYIADSNPYVDTLILNRQVDAPVEARSGTAFGLWVCRMDAGDMIIATRGRKIWAAFRNINKKAKTLEASGFAKSVIGIQKWPDVVPDFRWRGLKK